MSIKQDRMSERIQGILSELLLREVSDPRLQHITVTEVKLDPELMFATIYINALGDESREPEVMAGLQRAKGFLRREVGKRIRLRNSPDLVFHWDKTLARGERMHQIISSLDIPADPVKPAKAEDQDDSELE
ncbi:MAG: 30S ribosome-binding factor RbfA [Chloroflexi bacterium]|nr:30S ribosome-binding factor RbfA [Chloroflexota bacterium]MCC6896473.1 30S ribosome-binding factor RbfA [Anaerolineae bacterium]